MRYPPTFLTNTMEYLREYLAGEDALQGLPLLLAGPILRRTEADQVTVWVALKQRAHVRLQVFQTEAKGDRLDRCLLQGSRTTTALGKYLHVVAVTARAPKAESAASCEAPLTPERIYAYDLQFTADKPYSLAAALAYPNRPGETDRSAETISYFAHQKPTFVVPPTQLKHLKIAHGSCRKPHGAGFDTLPILDALITETASASHLRPHQLFLTGDQIYGDDVAEPLLWLASALGDTLLGWEEPLPVEPIEHYASSPAAHPAAHPAAQRPGTQKIKPKKLPAGQRADLSIRQAGLTAGLNNKRDRTTSHLFSFGEYCASYLLAYSPACWPLHLPMGREITQDRKAVRHWNKDRRQMEQFLHTLWKVRRLLANISTYTIFDDHDVSDDWNLNEEWCLRVLGRPLGRRTVQNALLSYAVFQAWGNTPQQFEPGETGAALLLAVQQWSHSAGQDHQAEGAIATYLGLPTIDPHTDLPQFVPDNVLDNKDHKTVWVLKRPQPALTWHYTIRSACHEVIVLDTRTQRGYPVNRSPIAPPMLLSPSAFTQQLTEPLSQPVNGSNYATFVVAPTNVFGMRALDWIQQWYLDRRKIFAADVGDSWNLNNEALAMLLTALLQHRQSVIVLSGDIHYSSAIQAHYQNLRSGQQSMLVQLTSSAIKNEELLTQILHTRLKEWLLPERPREWIGYLSPPDLEERSPSFQSSSKPSSQMRSPDWQCQTTWLKRQRSRPVDITTAIAELIPSPIARSQHSLLQRLKFWQTRWFQEGREVVGINNIAVVHFNSPTSSDQHSRNLSDNPPDNPSDNPSDKQPPLAVSQNHYWFSPWSPTQLVCSKFESALLYGEEAGRGSIL